MKNLLSFLWVLVPIFLNGLKTIQSKAFDSASLDAVDGLKSPDLPEGYSIYVGSNVAYKIYKDAKTWGDARARCVLDGGDLAIANTREKIQHIQNLDSDKGYWLHVGIYKSPGSQRWKTVDNVELSTSSIPWAWSEPDQTSNNYDCVAIVVSEVGLSDNECTRETIFVCEIQVPTSNVHGKEAGLVEGTTQDSLLPPLPKGYSVYPGDNVAYKIYQVFVTWTDARTRCSLDGGDLAIADTREKIQYIQNMDSSVDYWLFVGLQKPAGSEKWKTVNNVELSTSSIPWAWAAPHRTLDADDCAAIVLTDGGLSEFECTRKALFVCEIPSDGYRAVIDDITIITTPQSSISTTVAPQTILKPNLPDGYVEFLQFNTAYKIYEEHLTHYEARDRCFSDGGRLAVVDSFEKINVIAAILKSEQVHVGIRISSSNVEEWVVDSDGKPLKDLPWILDNAHPTKCAAITENGTGLKDTLCSNKLQFLCEIKKTNITGKKQKIKKNY